MESKKTLVVAGLFFGLLFTEMDETIIGTAMPTIIRELGGLALYGWVSGIYLLALTAGLPMMGKLADLYGRKRIYLCALGLFVAGSTLSGFAPSMPALLCFRAVQGIGGAGLIPLASVIVADLFPLKQRARIQGFFGSLYVIVTTVGPAVGGLLTQYADWRWIFYMNLPFGLIAALFIAIGLKESTAESRGGLDYAGTLLLPAGLIPLLLASVMTGDGAGRYTWSSPLILVLAASGLLLLVLFIRVESKAENPILPLYLFRRRVVVLVSALAFCVSFGTFGVLTYLPFYAQNVMGFSPAAAGYLMTPLAIGVVVSGLVFAFLIAKVAYRTLIALSLCIAAAGFGLLAAMPLNGSVLLPYVYVFIAGLGIGVIMMGKETVVQEQVNKEDTGAATAAVSLISQLGAATSVSLLGGVLSSSAASRFAAIKPGLTPEEGLEIQRMLDGGIAGGLSGPLLERMREIYHYGVQHVLIITLIVISAALVISLFLGKGRLGSVPFKPRTIRTRSKG